MKSHRDVIEAIRERGSLLELAHECGVRAPTIYGWREASSIPHARCRRLRRYAASVGVLVTAEELELMAERQTMAAQSRDVRRNVLKGAQ